MLSRPGGVRQKVHTRAARRRFNAPNATKGEGTTARSKKAADFAVCLKAAGLGFCSDQVIGCRGFCFVRGFHTSDREGKRRARCRPVDVIAPAGWQCPSRYMPGRGFTYDEAMSYCGCRPPWPRHRCQRRSAMGRGNWPSRGKLLPELFFFRNVAQHFFCLLWTLSNIYFGSF
jgi:hypothetical protein